MSTNTMASPSPFFGNLTIRQGNSNTGGYGNSGGHSHPTGASANGSFNTSLNFAVQYVDIILCSYSGT